MKVSIAPGYEDGQPLPNGLTSIDLNTFLRLVEGANKAQIEAMILSLKMRYDRFTSEDMLSEAFKTRF